MAILSRQPVADATVLATHELRVEAPIERRRELRDFYVRLVGLREWPPEAQIPGGWGAGPPRCGAYFQFRHDARVERLRRRLVICVPSLSAVAERLTAEQRPCLRLRGLGPADRCLLVTDPVGHRVELRQTRSL